MGAHIIMLGDCTLAGTYLSAHETNEALLHARLIATYPNDDLSIINEGRDGESLAGLLARYSETMRRHPQADYAIIRYGVNDRKEYGPEGFSQRLDEVCGRLRDDRPGIRILLETGIYVDFPAHYEFDRNHVLQPMYEAIRAFARRSGLPVIDIYERMLLETRKGNWDLRVRGYGIVDARIPVLDDRDDHLHVGDVRWWTNIHPNVRGIAVIADEEARVFGNMWPATLRRSGP
jgi:lysophospholipase L1-like esterase